MDAHAIFVEPVKALVTRLANFIVPDLIAALIALFVGWLIARLVQEFFVKLLKMLRVDELSERAGMEGMLRKGGVGHSFSELLGIFLYWLIMLAALVVALNALRLTVAAELLDRVLRYIPEVLAGIIVLILGSFFASMLGSVIQTVSANAGIHQARLLGQVARVVIVIFAIEVALEKFIGMTTLHMQLNIIVAALAFGTALAFGLGCKDLAGRWMADVIERLRRG